MTYIELIIVLGIFSIMSSTIIFNYAKFQEKIDIRNLSNEIALKIVEAQKTAMSGKFQNNAPIGWRPSYGIYFNISNPSSFTYFADYDSNQQYDEGSGGCLNSGTECLDSINITKNNRINSINVFGNGCPSSVNDIDIVYTRPNVGASFYSPTLNCTVSYISVKIISPQSVSANIDIYPSGQVQIK